ncbi:MAG: hypothetical protein ABIZ56_01355, partial [Chthoniobacteraceae bacterium]
RSRGFLHPIGKEFQIKFDRRIAHWNRVTSFSGDCKWTASQLFSGLGKTENYLLPSLPRASKA